MNKGNTPLQINAQIQKIQVYQVIIHVLNENEAFDIQVGEDVPKTIKLFSLNAEKHQYCSSCDEYY